MVTYHSFEVKPRLKRLPASLKLVKKIEVQKIFYRESSVFAELHPESKALYKKCFEYDMKWSKIGRIVKDPRELELVKEILLKYYGELKGQFYSSIALSDYPTI